MGVFQHGGLPSHSFCRQIYHPEVKGGTPAEEREFQHGGQVYEAGKFAFTCFLFFPLKNKEVCRLLTKGQSP